MIKLQGRAIRTENILIALYNYQKKANRMSDTTGMEGFSFNYLVNPQYYVNSGQLVFTDGFFRQSLVLTNQMNPETPLTELQAKYDRLLLQFQNVKSKFQEVEKKQQSNIQKRKIIRRKEDQLQKKYQCCYDHCKKEYASILALNLHIKNKHKGGTKKQRDDQAQKIILAEINGFTIPKLTINLPKGYVETYRKQHMSLHKTLNDGNTILQ